MEKTLKINKDNTILSVEDTGSTVLKQDDKTYLLIELDMLSPDETGGYYEEANQNKAIEHIKTALNDLAETVDEANREKHTDYAMENMEDAFDVLEDRN